MTVRTARSARRPLAAIVGYTLRACLPRRRWVGILLPAAAALLFGLIASTVDRPAVDAFASVASPALFALVMPVTCLVVGDAVLGAELRAGSFAFTWLSPVPTWKIAVGRWVGGTLVAAASLAIAFAAAAFVAGAAESAGAAAVAAAFGAQAYVAVFIAIGSMARRAAVWSLALVFLVERLVGDALAGIAQLSPSWLAGSAFLGLSDTRDEFVRDGIPQGGAAVGRLLMICAVALALATARLRHLRQTGGSD